MKVTEESLALIFEAVTLPFSSTVTVEVAGSTSKPKVKSLAFGSPFSATGPAVSQVPWAIRPLMYLRQDCLTPQSKEPDSMVQVSASAADACGTVIAVAAIAVTRILLSMEFLQLM